MQLGAWAEQQAATDATTRLSAHCRNWHSRYGELDLVMQREQELVFVEVKARAKTGYALAYESVFCQATKSPTNGVCFIQKSTV